MGHRMNFATRASDGRTSGRCAARLWKTADGILFDKARSRGSLRHVLAEKCHAGNRAGASPRGRRSRREGFAGRAGARKRYEKNGGRTGPVSPAGKRKASEEMRASSICGVQAGRNARHVMLCWLHGTTKRSRRLGRSVPHFFRSNLAIKIDPKNLPVSAVFDDRNRFRRGS